MEYQGGTILDINCVSIGKEPYDDGYISHVTNFRFELMLQHSVIYLFKQVVYYFLKSKMFSKSSRIKD